MKIAIFNPKNEFTKEQQIKLSQLGEVVYTKTRDELPLNKLLEMAKNADILGVDPDPLGGFEKAKKVLTKIAESLPNLKGVALSTTAYGWIDVTYFKKRNIPVSNIPGYSRESVAEHAFALLLCLAKRIIISDRKTQKGNYELEMGFELKEKTLGIIGLGNIGSRVSEIGKCFGMRVIAYNKSKKRMKGVTMKSLDGVLRNSDALSLHVTDNPGNKKMISKKEIDKMKERVIIVNTVDRAIVDEKAMANAIKSGKVGGYAYEAEDLEHTPLAKIENAIGLKGFGWYTKDALENLFEIWAENIISVAKGKPIHVIK
ncbi:MAG: D-3-phosphoglycerate dehydrogenase [Microgenomates group bacterium GW2011_GWC1_41_8]|uniref:D-3-phosphoglycerate dehydrogenase n=3 Tax=Candidatus Roizmaniibacteriota TaxID=1752723 RepID=A0A0G0XDZ9_9BACT|nr:MAG: D-3-phosphoglycerate dehydrogenase [Candidatus Roizmanbacteria bacterium GW2011_GWB1_40_7]KKR92342.1 MAG: D-3-phosphoglycerate dehydrogenase [Candidatus Roizmanbacteria bacterium GW2011_GWA1_41_13]KKS22288.1 MAG: D-3-phosphoglycerate dehydrogenase [Microgenomates group bacterium GW2011_GWC1_41_8]KKS23089.1 MAG: D-3-phosphoglycerate dehydrogenase [Candidatus Roizmanbacteria bacterium GW2011_GWC2_41_7]